MGEGTVRAYGDTVSAVVADGFPSRHHFRNTVSIFQLDDYHGALARSHAVLFALGFVDDQKRHSSLSLLFCSLDRMTEYTG
jgi:hypothetical protein